jgi:two-component system nitrogen regulation response regulator NtrX
MSLRTQGKLLRVLQEQEFQRVGGGRTISVDVRIIAATNKDLEKEIRHGSFREDLYYRLNVIPIQVPPLRERREDISSLVDTFLSECARQSRSRPKRISEEVLKRLCAYDWPGNVRELKNLVERLTIMVESEIITEMDLPFPQRSALIESHPIKGEALFMMESLEEARQAFEMAFIRRKLAEQDNDVNRVATEIGVSGSYLQRRLKPEP